MFVANISYAQSKLDSIKKSRFHAYGPTYEEIMGVYISSDSKDTLTLFPGNRAGMYRLIHHDSNNIVHRYEREMSYADHSETDDILPDWVGRLWLRIDRGSYLTSISFWVEWDNEGKIHLTPAHKRAYVYKTYIKSD